VPEAFKLVVALLPLRNFIVIYDSYNPQTSAPDTRVVGRLVTDKPGITVLLWTRDQLVSGTSDNTQHSQLANIHTSGGIRTHHFSRRAAADLSNRQRDHLDWLTMLCYAMLCYVMLCYVMLCYVMLS